jgi:hypothetical protein
MSKRRVEVQGLVPARATGICECTSPHISAALVYTNTSSCMLQPPGEQLPVVSHILLRLHTVEAQYKKPLMGISQGGFSRRQGFFANPLRLCIHQVTQHHINVCFDPANTFQIPGRQPTEFVNLQFDVCFRRVLARRLEISDCLFFFSQSALLF